MQVTFDNLPQAVQQALNELAAIKSMLSIQTKPLQQKSEDLLTIREAADFLHLTVPTLYGLSSRCEIPVMKKGKRLYFSKEQLSKWIQGGRKASLSDVSQSVDTFLIARKRRAA